MCFEDEVHRQLIAHKAWLLQQGKDLSVSKIVNRLLKVVLPEVGQE